jgi:hypothetical protein
VASGREPHDAHPARVDVPFTDDIDQQSARPDFCVLIYPAYLEETENKEHLGVLAPGLPPPANGILRGFQLAVADGVFSDTPAVIDGDSGLASCDQVAPPVFIRYNRIDMGMGNFFNKEGRHASIHNDTFPAGGLVQNGIACRFDR